MLASEARKAGSANEVTRLTPILTQKRNISIPHLHLTPPYWSARRNFAKAFSVGKTRMIGLSHAEESMMVGLC